MTDSVNDAVQASPDRFVWHPEYAGKTFEGVRRELEDDIQRDQRAYDLALEQAEKEEFGAFNSVRELEKRWSEYDFGWVEVPAKVLADRILAFERARDKRQELFGWQEWKDESLAQTKVTDMSTQKPDWRENLSDEQRRKIASAASIAILFGLVVVCAAVYMLVR